jgi:hypothetical protein
VIVVDNASEDGSPEMIRREFPAVRLLGNDSNLGFAVGSNRAISESIGRYVLLLNSDTLVMPGTLQTMADFLDVSPDVGVAGCKLLNPDGTVQVSHHHFPSISWDYLKDVLTLKLFHHIKPLRPAMLRLINCQVPEARRPVDWVSGACLMTRKEVFDDIGLLDERFFMFCEEIDWCRRASRAGWRIYYLPDAHVVHYGGQSSRHDRLRTYWVLLRSTYHYFRKLHSQDSPI